MILIAIEEAKGKFILHAVDTYSGSSTAIAAQTADEMLLRFHPLLRSWLDFSHGKRERFINTGTPPPES